MSIHSENKDKGEGLRRSDQPRKTATKGTTSSAQRRKKRGQDRGFFGKLKRVATAPVRSTAKLGKGVAKAGVKVAKATGRSIKEAAKGNPIQAVKDGAKGLRDAAKETKKSIASSAKTAVLKEEKQTRQANRKARQEAQTSPNTQRPNRTRKAESSPNTRQPAYQTGHKKSGGRDAKAGSSQLQDSKRAFAKSSGVKRGTREFREAFKSRKR